MINNRQQGTFQIDIKETVHLSHEKLPIEEIEEMELVPQIESRENGDHIEIVGCLYLYGDYKGNQDAGRLEPLNHLPESYEESVQFEPLSADRGPFSPLAREDRFEYRIPVQITLPRGKVKDVDEVYAFINSFDYEMSSPYQIDVVASLVISGLLDKEEDMDKKEKVEDQFEFVHIAGQDNNHEPVRDTYAERLQAIEQQASGQENERQEEQEESQPFAFQDLRAEQWEQAEPEPQEDETAMGNDEEQEREPEAEQEEAADNVVPLPQLHVMEEERPIEPSDDLEQDEEDIGEDVKVAISNKGTRKDQEPISSLSSFFASRAPQSEMPDQRSEPEADEEEDNEALYLTNFMDNHDDQFTKIRICILQKDETIDEIAERYHMTADQILRINQTARNQVAAGQLLYIPVKG